MLWCQEREPPLIRSFSLNLFLFLHKNINSNFESNVTNKNKKTPKLL